MSQILDQLIDDLAERLSSLRADRHTHTAYLKDEDPKRMILLSFAHILKGIERKATLVDLSVTVGRRLMQALKVKRNSVKACHTGWFVLVSFIETGLLSYKLKHGKTKKGRNSKYLTYQIVVKNKKAILELWDKITEEEHIDMFPDSRPPADWVSGTHETGVGIIKRSKSEVLKKFNPEDQPVVFRVLNKLGRTPWMVNKPVFDVLEHYMQSEETPSPLKYVEETNTERKESLYIETSSVYRLAKKNLDNNFFHLYNTDFRGRIYVNTSFFHEQASDNAKGLLLLAEGDRLGEEGLYWLLLHTANCYGYDKDTLDNRVEWSLQRYNELLAYATDPYNNTEWFKADKPFCFLAACMELKLLEDWVAAGNEQEEFVSHLPVAFDGVRRH